MWHNLDARNCLAYPHRCRPGKGTTEPVLQARNIGVLGIYDEADGIDRGHGNFSCFLILKKVFHSSKEVRICSQTTFTRQGTLRCQINEST